MCAGCKPFVRYGFCQNFFPAVACLFIFLQIYFDEQVFLFLLKLSLLCFSARHTPLLGIHVFQTRLKKPLPSPKVIKIFSYLFLLVAFCFSSYIYDCIHS